MENSSAKISPAHIRAAVRADLPRILQIERSAATAAHWSEADYEIALTGIIPHRWLMVAETELRIEGFLVALAADTSRWEIENLVVAEEARRRGVGVSLLNLFLKQAREHSLSDKAPTILLEVRESNLGALRLYEKAGFRLDARRRAYYRDPVEDGLLYSLCLQ